MEGTLFVVKRSAFPKFRVMVLNRVGLDNMELDINPGFTFELSVPYIMYKEGDDGVKGLWFYDQEEAALVAALLRKIADTLDAAAAKQQAARASKQAARRAQAQAQGASAARAAQAVASAAQGRRTAAESASGRPAPSGGDVDAAGDITLLLQKMAAGASQGGAGAPRPPAASPPPPEEGGASADDGDHSFMALLQRAGMAAGDAPAPASPPRPPKSQAAPAAKKAKAAAAAVTPAAIAMALRELAEDGAFTARVAAAINRHASA